MYGARLSLLAPLGVVVIATVAGVVIGLAAARGPGWLDTLLSRSMDVVFAFPGLLLAMLAVAVFGPGLPRRWSPSRSATPRSSAGWCAAWRCRRRPRPYVDSYQVMGFSRLAVTVRHILPNLVPVIAAQSALSFGYALVDLATLSFLGLGVRPPASDWGVDDRPGAAGPAAGPAVERDRPRRSRCCSP